MHIEQELFDVLRAFASLQSIPSLKWPYSIPFTKTQNFLLNSVLLDSHFSTYPPSIQYQRRFWKWAIENMELALQKVEHGTDEYEIDERFYERLLELLHDSGPSIGSSNPASRDQICGRGLPLNQQPADSYVTYYWQFTPQTGPDDDSITTNNLVDIRRYHTATLLESRRMIESGTTGLRTWNASFVLAEHLAMNPHLILGRRVLELGAGVGFLGIVVASLQLKHGSTPANNSLGALYLTDVNEEVLTRCRSNILLPCNLLANHPKINIQTLDWFAALSDVRGDTLVPVLDNEIMPNVILGADIAFDPSLIPSLVATLKLAFKSMHKRGNDESQSNCALMAVPLRNHTTLDAFLSQISDNGLKVLQIPIISTNHTDVFLFQITAS